MKKTVSGVLSFSLLFCSAGLAPYQALGQTTFRPASAGPVFQGALATNLPQGNPQGIGVEGPDLGTLAGGLAAEGIGGLDAPGSLETPLSPEGFAPLGTGISDFRTREGRSRTLVGNLTRAGGMKPNVSPSRQEGGTNRETDSAQEAQEGQAPSKLDALFDLKKGRAGFNTKDLPSVLGGGEGTSRLEPPTAAKAPRGSLMARAVSTAGRLTGSAGRLARSTRLSEGGGRLLAGLGFGSVLAWLAQGLASGPADPAFLAFKGALLFTVVLASITLHEAAHAWTAERMGDVTARMAGQVSANPIRYTSPGSATMLLVTALLGVPFGFFFTVMQQKLASPRHKGRMAVVALAGPAMNFLITGLLVGGIALAKAASPELVAIPLIGGTLKTLAFAAFLNWILAVANLIPLGPLDGQKVARAAVPDKKVGGRSLVRLFDAVTVPLGLILLLYLMFKGLFSNIFGPSGAAGVGGQGGAEALSFGDLILGNFTNPFTLAMFVLGFILWGFAVRPWVKEKLRLAREARQRAKVVEDGGYEIGLISAVLKGKAPKLALLSGLLAVPWSGPKEAPRPEGSFALVHDLDGLEGTGAKAVDLADGREVALDSTLLARLATGELVLLEAMEDPAEESGAGPEDGSAPSGPKLAFVSSALLGGRSKVQTSLETEQVAHRLSMNDGGREILTRTQVRAVKGLSKALKAPVYELDWEPELPHRSVASYVQAERGGTFFVRLKVLRALEGLPGPERTVRLREVEEYLGALRISQEAGRPLPEAYRNFMEKMPQLAQWLRSGGIVR